MAEALSLFAGAPTTTPDRAPQLVPTTTLAVENMNCGGCIRNIEKALNAMPGVTATRANLTTKRVVIRTEAPPASAEEFIAALARAGFKASALTVGGARPSAGANQDYLKRLGVAGFAAANIMLLSVAVWSGFGSDMPASIHTLFHWLSAIIALPAIAYAGHPFFMSARAALSAGRLNMDVPISLGVTLATAMSLFQTWRGSDQVYFDAAVMLLFFLLIGRALDERMRARAVSAAQNLLGLRAAAASIINADGTIERVATDAVQPGMRVLIAAGERIPVDARVTSGVVEIDESLITGESRPRTVAAGGQLYSGTVALTGPIEAEATAVADNTLLAEIARLIETAEQARGRYVRLADRAAKLYAPAVHILGLTTFIGWMITGHGWEGALTAAIAVLIITCPCALALAVPAVQVVATSRLFRQGIVLKAADGLERLAEVDTVAFDKTGTLTLGRPELTAAADIPATVLSAAAGLAAQSRHPYAKAVVRAALERGIPHAATSGVEEIAGAGMRATVNGQELRLGSARFCDVDASRDGDQTLWFRNGDSAPVALAVSDPLRPDAAAVAQRLAQAGFGLEIISGDRRAAVETMAHSVGIGSWYAAQMPAQKIARIKALAAEGRKVLMVGDGLNDAPALAAGHAAMSPSSAADISQNAADAVFQGDRLEPVIEALAVAKAARRRSLENFAIAIGYNAIFVPLAMLGLVTPLIAALAMSASSIAVTANALRLSGQSLEARR